MRHRRLLALALVAGCSPDPGPAASGPSPSPPKAVALPATWSVTPAEYRGQNTSRLVFRCPPDPTREDVGAVWGSGVYSDDSAVRAAVHAGVLPFARGGRVAVTIRSGRDRYAGTACHGVVSSSWSS